MYLILTDIPRVAEKPDSREYAALVSSSHSPGPGSSWPCPRSASRCTGPRRATPTLRLLRPQPGTSSFADADFWIESGNKLRHVVIVQKLLIHCWRVQLFEEQHIQYLNDYIERLDTLAVPNTEKRKCICEQSSPWRSDICPIAPNGPVGFYRKLKFSSLLEVHFTHLRK